jgi:hypothetical protein
MVASITQTDTRAARTDGLLAPEDRARSGFSLDRNGSSSAGSKDLASKDQGSHFLTQKGEEFRKLIDDRSDDAPADEPGQSQGIFSLFVPQAAQAQPVTMIMPDPQPAPVDVSVTIDRIATLVRDFNLRDPLLASQSLSCSVNFAEGFSVPTSVATNRLGELQVKISANAETFGVRSGLRVAALEEALAARFPRHRLRVEFVGEDHDHA